MRVQALTPASNSDRVTRAMAGGFCWPVRDLAAVVVGRPKVYVAKAHLEQPGR